jgi:sRNA-binding protein
MIPHVSKSLVKSMDSLKLSAKLQKSLIEYLELEQAEVIRNSEINIKALDKKPKPESQAKKVEASTDKVTDSTSVAKSTDSQPVAKNQEVLDADPEIQQDAETTVSEADNLKLGDWIEIKDDDTKILAKLTWRAEDSSLFIFVDREGTRVREVDGVTLDYEIAAGQITVASAESKAPQKKSILSFFNTI